MALSKKPYKGTRDFFPVDKRVQDFLFDHMKKTAHLFAYESYDGPMLEEVELYKAKSGEELINDQIYSFTDRGNRFVAIRPEMTPTLARMIASCHKEVPKPIRWFSIPNLMRYERPQRGRLREHWQFNCDIFGAPDGLGDFEIISLAISLLNSFGANEKHFSIRLNDRRLVELLFNKKMKLEKDLQYKLYKVIDKAKKVDQQTIDKNLTDLNLSSDQIESFNTYLSLSSIKEALTFFSNINQEATTPLSSFLELASNSGIDKYIQYDPAVVRGLDYYTGIVFEIFDEHPDNNRAICGGGAYADLLKIFNEEALSGVGFGLGDVTLKNFLESHNLLPDLSHSDFDIYLSFQEQGGLSEILKLSNKLRSEGLSVLTALEPIKLKKVFPFAEKKGINFVILFGENEQKENKIQLKNLKTKEQHEIDLSNINQILKMVKL